MAEEKRSLDRRDLLKKTVAGVGAVAVSNSVLADEKKKTANEKPPVDPDKLIWKSKAPTMEYRRLGRTNFMVSRIVAGWIHDKAIWRRVLSRGVNYFDNARGYGNYEVEQSEFLKKYRDKLWIISKASNIAGFRKVDAEVEKLYRKAMKDYLGAGDEDLLSLYNKAVQKEKATGEKPDLRPAEKRIAKLYVEKLDESLSRMGIDDVDSYFVHGICIPWIFDCVGLWEAYEKVHKAGKVKHFGFSVHANHKSVLAAGVEANKRGPWKIDLIMPGVNPESFDQLKPELAAFKQQDVGIIAMKTKGIANRPVDGREKKFETLTGGKDYNEWERAKLWMLHLTEDLIDSCIANVANNNEMERTLALPMVRLSAAAQRELRTLVKREMAGICHLCGHCMTVCPEQIALTDMIRYHAYVYQYDERELARELYTQAGYDPAKVCSNCGQCEQVCGSQVQIRKLLQQLAADFA